jgi:GNAT superfamily N-acetyltransferase
VISIRPLEHHHLDEADRIFRLAFGTFMNLPDPMQFMGDADLIHTRFTADPHCALGAFEGDQLLGSNFIAVWGSFAFLGPLTVRPDLWDKGIAKQLLAATMPLFDRRNVSHTGLFTFPHSPKHHALYQKFGYWPQYLTPVMAKSLDPNDTPPEWTAFSTASPGRRATHLAECSRLTDEIFPGLNLESEIQSVANQSLGETILLHDNNALSAFAIIHTGKGSEAPTTTAYIKFAAARPGPAAPQAIDRLLLAAESFASSRGAQTITTGVNTARNHACQHLLARNYKTAFTGVAMQRPNQPGYNRPDCLVLDDWR